MRFSIIIENIQNYSAAVLFSLFEIWQFYNIMHGAFFLDMVYACKLNVVRTVMQASIPLLDRVPRSHTSAALISARSAAQCTASTQCAILPLVNSHFGYVCVCVCT